MKTVVFIEYNEEKSKGLRNGLSLTLLSFLSPSVLNMEACYMAMQLTTTADNKFWSRQQTTIGNNTWKQKTRVEKKIIFFKACLFLSIVVVVVVVDIFICMRLKLSATQML